MLNERFTLAIPDEFPKNLEGEDLEELERLFSQLRLKIKTVQTRRIEAAEKYAVGIHPMAELEARLDLLIDMFIGVLSPERMRLELNWQERISTALELGISDAQEQARQERQAKTLHLPNGRSYKVAPAEDNDGD